MPEVPKREQELEAAVDRMLRILDIVQDVLNRAAARDPARLSSVPAEHRWLSAFIAVSERYLV